MRLVPAQLAGATLVASFATMTAASRAVIAIRGRVRCSMLELMDGVTINAVEDWRSHGLDRSAGALFEDVGVPIPQLPELVDGIARVARTCGVEIALVARRGSGRSSG